MNITERAQKVLTEIDAALAMADKATQGPWTMCGGYTPHYSAIQASGVYVIHQFADQTTDKEQGRPLPAPSAEQQRHNAAFIAASRTLLPASLLCLKTAIEGLMKLHKVNDTSEVLNVSITMGMSRFESNVALTTLCDQWEAER
jgi:hypothetical protein